MSFYVDPWLYNCRANPADSPAEQAQQATIIDASQRAVDYARARGVTLIGAMGNEITDLGNPTSTRPAPTTRRARRARGRSTTRASTSRPRSRAWSAVSAVGPSGRKAYYSNYGTEQTDVSAPGGDARDYFGTDRYLSAANRILSTTPQAVAEAGDRGEPGHAARASGDCQGEHLRLLLLPAGDVDGRAARRGRGGADHGPVRPRGPAPRRARSSSPTRVQRILERTARGACVPGAEPVRLPGPGAAATRTPRAARATTSCNGFYGHGVVNALNAVSMRR